MPQTLTDPWRAELGPAAEEVHRRYLHVLGNLTLTGYNPELSNKPFAQKRVLLAESNVAMNKTIAKEVQWSDAQIVERGRQFADLAVQIWPGPASSLRCSQASGNAGNVRGRGSDNDALFPTLVLVQPHRDTAPAQRAFLWPSGR